MQKILVSNAFHHFGVQETNVSKPKLIWLMVCCLCLSIISVKSAAEPANIHVSFAWLDGNNCPACTIAVLRLVVADDHRIFASNVMLQSYSKITSSYNRSIEIDQSGNWKCA